MIQLLSIGLDQLILRVMLIFIEDYNELDFDAPYKIGQEIYIKILTYGNVGILAWNSI
jgi:hypothetical protein